MSETTEVFRQVRNDEKDIEAILDGYKSRIRHDAWLADGLQKDAIQNGWDARIKKHGDGWECGFSLNKTGKETLLVIVDSGTYGLRGTRFRTEGELSKILLGGKREEDLACFLNSNWSAKSHEEGGTRGRGKTIFMGASKDKRLYFESVRSSDGSYVFGEIYLDTDKQIKFKLFYDDPAKSLFADVTNNKIELLVESGTRILIPNPREEIVAAIKNGTALSLISSSHWEIIKKYGAKIYVYD